MPRKTADFSAAIAGLEAHGFSRSEIAQQVGISRMTVWRIAEGVVHQPSYSTAERLGQLYESAVGEKTPARRWTCRVLRNHHHPACIFRAVLKAWGQSPRRSHDMRDVEYAAQSERLEDNTDYETFSLMGDSVSISDTPGHCLESTDSSAPSWLRTRGNAQTGCHWPETEPSRWQYEQGRSAELRTAFFIIGISAASTAGWPAQPSPAPPAWGPAATQPRG